MKNLKKLLAVIVTVAMCATFMIPAFAASPSAVSEGIEDEDVKLAVEKLTAFGIVAGKEDGLYHPEENITRDAFVKILVEALGLGSAAAQGATQFSDVPAERWSSGYIKVAAGAGIVKGRGDGTFGPLDNVTYAEAVTMIVRALGYKDEWLPGSWPDKFFTKAADLDITDGVDFSNNGYANRGAVALMISNALDAKMVTQSTYGSEAEWEEGNKTLLEKKLEIVKLEDCKITATPQVDEDLDEDEIEVRIPIGEDDKDNPIYEREELEVVQEGLGLNNLLGLEANIYINDDDEIVYVDVTTDEDEIIWGMITGTDDGQITIKEVDGDDDDYDVNEDVKVYIDNADDDYDEDDLVEDTSEPLYGKFVINDDDEVVFAQLYSLDDCIVVNSIDEEDEYVKGIYYDKDDKKVDFAKRDGKRIFLGAEEISFDDIEEGDVLYAADKVADFDGDEYVYGFVVRNTVEGELSKITSGSLKIGDDSYDINAYIGGMSYSLDEGDSIDLFTDAEDLEDASREDVVAYLDLKGEIVYLSTSANVTSDTLYGIVTKTNEITDDEVKIFTSSGDDVTYKLDDDAARNTIDEGDIVEYKLSKDGTIDYESDGSGDYKVLADAADIDADFGYLVVSLEDDNDYIKVQDSEGDTDKFYVTDDTVIMSYYDDEGNVDPDIVSWEDIEGDDIADDARAYVKVDDDGINAEFIVFTVNYNLSSDLEAGYLTDDPYYDDGDWKFDLTLASGDEVTYVLDDSSVKSGIEEGHFVVFKTNQSGNISSVTKAVYDLNGYTIGTDIGGDGWTIDAGKVDTVSGKTIKLKENYRDDKTYKVLNSTGIFELVVDDTGAYDEVNDADMADIDDDDIIRVIENDDGDLVMVVIIDDSDYDYGEED